MRLFTIACRAALLLLLIAGSGGCTDSTVPAEPYTRVAVAGTVSLDGNPLNTGMIQFNPAGETKGPPASGSIVAGKFTISQAQGPAPGKYKVSISGKAPVEIGANEQPGGTPTKTAEPIPARYNTQTTLETQIPAGGSSTLDFALKK